MGKKNAAIAFLQIYIFQVFIAFDSETDRAGWDVFYIPAGSYNSGCR